MSIRQLSYAQSLQHAKTESESLKGQIRDLEAQESELRQLQQRIEKKYFNAFRNQLIEINTNLIWLRAALDRSRGKALLYTRLIAESAKPVAVTVEVAALAA